MPAELVGMVTGQVVSEIRLGLQPPVDPAVIAEFARRHEAAAFDRVLLGYSAVEADTWLIASHVLQATRTLRVLVAHRPGFVPPTLAARKAATLEALHGRGRVALNVVSGGSDTDQARDGDFLPHDERYARTAEFIEVVHRCWAEKEPFDHAGKFYKFVQAFSNIRPAHPDDIPIYFAGASPAAVEVGARLADVYMMWGEPLNDAADRLRAVTSAASVYGRRPRFALAVRVVLGKTESDAFARAERIAAATEAHMRDNAHSVFARYAAGTTAVGSQRLRAAAAKGDVLDERLWMKVARITGAPMNTTALVGTASQVARALLAYYDLGFTSLLLRGFDPLDDIAGLADVVELVKAGAADRDSGGRGRASSSGAGFQVG